MDEQIITVSPIPSVVIDLTPSACSQRATLLKRAADIDTIEDLISLDYANDTLKGLKQMSTTLEKVRKEVKQPVLDMSRTIDDTAKAFIAPVLDEIDRIGRSIAAFEKKRREEEARANEERRRLELEALKRADEAEKSGASNEEVAAQINREFSEARAATTVAKVAGIRVRTTTKWEITDLALFVRQNPDLCMPDPKKVNAAVTINRNIPGLRVWEESKAY